MLLASKHIKNIFDYISTSNLIAIQNTSVEGNEENLQTIRETELDNEGYLLRIGRSVNDKEYCQDTTKFGLDFPYFDFDFGIFPVIFVDNRKIKAKESSFIFCFF